MQAIHFGGGNIGRGFIGEILNANGFSVAFVDVNNDIIEALNQKKGYTIYLAEEGNHTVEIDRVYGINNGTDPEAVVDLFEKTDLVTTAIGPKILPYIAPLIAQGIQKRNSNGVTKPLDIIACENMIGGSSFLKEEVAKHLNESDKEYTQKYIGFPNAAVDRIVPAQTHEDVLSVTVEPYKEWVVESSDLKNTELKLEGVDYKEDLAPFIERKLFTVNTGHAATAYHGKYAGYHMIDEALNDETVLENVKNVLNETGALMVQKWNFDQTEHQQYIDKILNRFKNPFISDDISRVGRTPIRKLSFDERFIKPIREAYERQLKVDALIQTVAKALSYHDENDEESLELSQLLAEKTVLEVVRQVTKLTQEDLINRIVAEYESLKQS
ncbi:mannitol-1-phosphate 5-dehydrogenase [Desemzia sp. RIT804]|uniref:mannitol-1-phosphate 5-dehydrogenase n=1 Tax=Desemzia sp. RIT 804 TaxID=2810209 RepID=UPI00195204AA|nr:mannitol-1-phosphate 5-dehydrogenase [Desemzia sp. RIT 804]MBM6615933.1 mannitol-1-phosphate 5-dehydrogenase [Desemzia sp. RIT 804]